MFGCSSIRMREWCISVDNPHLRNPHSDNCLFLRWKTPLDYFRRIRVPNRLYYNRWLVTSSRLEIHGHCFVSSWARLHPFYPLYITRGGGFILRCEGNFRGFRLISTKPDVPVLWVLNGILAILWGKTALRTGIQIQGNWAMKGIAAFLLAALLVVTSGEPQTTTYPVYSLVRWIQSLKSIIFRYTVLGTWNWVFPINRQISVVFWARWLCSRCLYQLYPRGAVMVCVYGVWLASAWGHTHTPLFPNPCCNFSVRFMPSSLHARIHNSFTALYVLLWLHLS